MLEKCSDERCKVGFSCAENAAEDVCKQISGKTPLLVIFFSDVEGFALYSEYLHGYFPDSCVIGATTYVGYSSEGSSKKSLTALAVYEGIECVCGVIHDIKRYPMKHAGVISEAVNKFTSTKNLCCFELTTAFGQCEELVLDTYRSVLEERKIPIFGGSAGTSAEIIENTLVSLDGEVYDEASVFALIRNLNGKISLYRENMFVPTEHCFTATDVDCEQRTVYEFDGKPAAEVVAAAIGVDAENLSSALATHPLGRMIDGNIYVTEHCGIEPDGALLYFARIYNHTKMVLLEPGDMRKTVNDVLDSVKNQSFSLAVTCIGRMKYYEKNGVFDEYTKALSTKLGRFIGFSGFGEQLDFEHLNQTVLFAVFE